jgi:transcriptional regulator with XRE-family HTH domain
MLKTIFEQFVSDPKRHRIYEREALALRASELIFELMEKEGVSKAQLAERIGASRAHITQALSGARNMTVHTLADLSFVLGHKIELEALPLHGSKSAVVQYIPANTEKQECFFGTPSDDDCANEYCDSEGEHDVETNYPRAA